MHPSRLLAACVIVCIPALASACTESPTEVTEAGAEIPEPLLSATAANDESALITFETLSYRGQEENGDRDDDQDGEVEIVGEIDPESVIEESADLAVRVRKQDGTPIQGALVVWTVVEGNAELTSGSRTVTGPDGVSQQAVELGPWPDVIVILASLEQPQEQQEAGAASAQQEESGVVFRLLPCAATSLGVDSQTTSACWGSSRVKR